MMPSPAGSNRAWPADLGSSTEHVVIVGPMGSGKTTLGRLLAAGLNRPFLDSDDQIIDRTGRTGREIAEADGVDALHRLEREVFFEAISGSKPSVVAAAASVIDDEGAREAMGSTFCVSLAATPAILAIRASAGAHRRLIGDTEADHLAGRAVHFHDCADVIIDTEACSPEEAVALILEGRRFVPG